MGRLLTCLVLLLSCDAALACPMCKDSIANQEGSTDLRDAKTADGQNISSGMNASIYVMLGALFAVMGGVSAVIVKGIRSSNQTPAMPPRRTDEHDGAPR